MSNVRKEELHAVHDRDLEKFLEGLGLLGRVKEGKLTCSSCSCTITLDNFGGAYSESGGIKVVCDKLECVKPLLRGRTE